ncbi:MAG: type III secretion system chaperone [Pseudomonadota bacterium]
MSDASAVTLLFGELGTLLEPEAIIQDPEGDSWSIALVDGVTVDVSLDEERRMLVFVVDLGPPPQGRIAEVQDVLLRFGFLWRESGGIYAAIDDAGAAVLMQQAPLAGLDLPSLQRLIGRFSAHREAWSAMLDTVDQDPSESDEPGPPARGALV